MDESKETLVSHISKLILRNVTEEYDETSITVKYIADHSKLEHSIDQLDGSAEITKSKKKIKHDELWCYKCKEQQPDCKGCEFQISNRPVIKAHAQRA